MEYLLTSEEMKTYDSFTTDNHMIPEVVLMERAAIGSIPEIHESLKTQKSNHLVFLCGYGNNGADGLAVARLMALEGVDVSIIIIGNEEKSTSLNKLQRSILSSYGIEYFQTSDTSCAAAHMNSLLKTHSIIIDSIFGIGLSRDLSDDYITFFDRVNSHSAYTIALDVPSGLNQKNAGLGCVIKADKTLCYGFIKLDTIICPGAFYCGTVIKIPMGIDERSISGDKPKYFRYTDLSDCKLPQRNLYSNKVTNKKLLIIAGSADTYGAMYLAVKAAFSMGIGMVKVITDQSNRTLLLQNIPEAMCSFYSEDTQKDSLIQMFNATNEWADGILIGPGIGFSDNARTLVDLCISHSTKDLLLDADAIRILAADNTLKDCLKNTSDRNVIITPHVGEFACICNKSVPEVKEDLLTLPKKLADEYGITVICKDARSVIASYSYREICINSSGNDGLAKAGSGDVLAGIAAVLMIQLENPYAALCSAAYIHGIAGTLVSQVKGTRSMVAGDIINKISEIIK